jgi:hypothetical protein
MGERHHQPGDHGRQWVAYRPPCLNKNYYRLCSGLSTLSYTKWYSAIEIKDKFLEGQASSAEVARVLRSAESLGIVKYTLKAKKRVHVWLFQPKAILPWNIESSDSNISSTRITSKKRELEDGHDDEPLEYRSYASDSKRRMIEV